MHFAQPPIRSPGLFTDLFFCFLFFVLLFVLFFVFFWFFCFCFFLTNTQLPVVSYMPPMPMHGFINPILFFCCHRNHFTTCLFSRHHHHHDSTVDIALPTPQFSGSNLICLTFMQLATQSHSTKVSLLSPRLLVGFLTPIFQTFVIIPRHRRRIRYSGFFHIHLLQCRCYGQYFAVVVAC
jgi:hypothetical protein